MSIWMHTGRITRQLDLLEYVCWTGRKCVCVLVSMRVCVYLCINLFGDLETLQHLFPNRISDSTLLQNITLKGNQLTDVKVLFFFKPLGTFWTLYGFRYTMSTV